MSGSEEPYNTHGDNISAEQDKDAALLHGAHTIDEHFPFGPESAESVCHRACLLHANLTSDKRYMFPNQGLIVQAVR